MPRLKSGRHVALSTSPYLDAVTSGTDMARYYAITVLRLNANSPEALRDHVVIGYFVEGRGTPPNAPSYSSGYCVGDVLEGRSDWSLDEVAEFRAYLAQDPRVGPWLQAQFDDLDQAIRENPVWQSDLLRDDDSPDGVSAQEIKRALIYQSALEPDAMAKLRALPG